MKILIGDFHTEFFPADDTIFFFSLCSQWIELIQPRLLFLARGAFHQP